MKEYYRQCKMKKCIGENIFLLDVAWIPEKFSKMGKNIKIKQTDGTWESGWEITEVGDVRKDKEFLFVGEKDYKNQRKASDV